MVSTGLSLSDLIVATPQQIHPHLQKTTEQIQAFCHHHDIWLDNFDEYHTMAAYMFPRTSEDRLVTINILMDLLWFIDDYYTRERRDVHENDHKALANAFKDGMKILLYGQQPDQKDVWHDACFDLRDQILALGGERWLFRLGRSLSEHLQATTYSLAKIVEDGVLDVERYVAVREHDSGMQVAIDCVEFAYDIYIPDEVMADPWVQTMRRHCANVGGLINDLTSYHKEAEVGEERFNLISVFMESEGVDFHTAVKKSIDLINEFIADFLHKEQHIPDFGSPAVNEMVARYVQGLKDHIGASYHWQLNTNRYRSPDSPFPELQTMLPAGHIGESAA